jgi:hypothetical protein
MPRALNLAPVNFGLLGFGLLGLDWTVQDQRTQKRFRIRRTERVEAKYSRLVIQSAQPSYATGNWPKAKHSDWTPKLTIEGANIAYLQSRHLKAWSFKSRTIASSSTADAAWASSRSSTISVLEAVRYYFGRGSPVFGRGPPVCRFVPVFLVCMFPRPMPKTRFFTGLWLDCGCSSMVEQQPSKLNTWVRFPSPAPIT